MVVDHAINDGESETGAFPALFGGEERLEDVRLYLAAHADARVAHADTGIIFRGDAGKNFGEIRTRSDAGAKGESAALRHGIARIHTKVQQDLVKLAFVRRDERKIGLEFEMEIDCFGKCRLQHALEIADERVEIDRGKTRFSLAC